MCLLISDVRSLNIMIRSSLFVFVAFATSLTSPAVHRDRVDLCSSNEFTCGDGSCVPLARLCDGQRDCADARDESVCFLPSRNNTDLSLLGRTKRQATCHPKNQWQCRDGTCISFDGECDGVVDCPDGSDETYPRCRGKECQANWFRCTYGACVDGTAACNGIQDCADNSDELDPSCRTETDEVNGQFKCQNGQLISAANRCDGIADCADYSDESVRACAGRTCPSNLFQCAYGACVDQGSDCNGKTECADGSDESLELCDKSATVTTTTRPGGTPVRPGPKPSSSGSCVLPQYPDHGTYQVTNAPTAAPGQRFDIVYINVVCDPGYKVSGPSEIFCYRGDWSGSITDCVRFCKLNKHSSVEYKCLLTGGTNKGTRDCEDFEPVGTVAIPVCRTPNYYSPNVLNYMHCFEDGAWDYVAVCTPECGTVTPKGTGLVINGTSAKRGELPWHAGIYRKLERPYMQICGGSLITSKVVVSAAHCFWSSKKGLLPPANYAVGLGKIYRPFGESHDDKAQTSDVQDIKVPSRYTDSSSNFQEDIALVFLVSVIVFNPSVRPICLDFNVISDKRQLQDGNLGKVAGWGLTTKDGNPSGVLKVVQLPVIEINRCINESPITFRQYITSDKICAGYKNGTTVCMGDSGGGLAFPDVTQGVQRYYLRGIVSTAPSTDNACNVDFYTTFTQVSRHEPFIKEFVTFI